MSKNLITLVSEFLTPDRLGRMGSALGVDKVLVGDASAAAVPAIMSGLANLASTETGVRRLTHAIDQDNPDILDRFASAMGTSRQQPLIDAGVESLTSLLGGSTVSKIINAISDFSGLGKPTTSSLIGMLTPVVLGIVGRYKRDQRLDGPALAQTLSSQKSSFISAMPPAVAQRLRSKGLYDDLQPPRVQANSPSQPRAAASTRSVEPATRSSAAAWLLPMLALAGIALWYVNRDQGDQTQEVAVQEAVPIDRTTSVPTSSVSDVSRIDESRLPESTQGDTTLSAVDRNEMLSAEGVDLGSSIKTTLGNVTSTLEDISDTASATAALPKLNAASSELDRILELANQLPADGKSALAVVVSTSRPALDKLAEQVLAIPGVGNVAKPALDSLHAKLDRLSATT